MSEPIVPALAFRVKGENATNGTPISRTWSQWCAWVLRPKKYARKDAQPLLSFTKRKDNSRAKDAPPPELIYVLQADYDAGKVSAGEAARRLDAAGIKAAIHTSASHTSKKPRWRVIVPLAGPITPEQLPGHMDLLNGVLGGILGRESWDNERGFFFGRVEGIEYEPHIVEGEYFDVLLVTEDWTPIGKPAAMKDAAEKQISVATSELPAGIEPRSDTENTIATALDNQTWFAALGSFAKTLEGKSLEDREEGVARAVVLSLPNWEPGDGFTDCEAHVRAIMKRTFDKFGTKTDVQLREEVRGRFDDLSTVDLGDDPFEASRYNKIDAHIKARIRKPLDIDNEPWPEYLVYGFLMKNGLVQAYGPPGIGKSAVMYELAWSLVRGVSFCGMDVDRKYRVLWIAAEAYKSMKRRQRGYAQKCELTIEQLSAEGQLDVWYGFNANDPEQVEALRLHVKRERYDAVLLDTKAAATPGSDENTVKDQGEFHQMCRSIVEQDIGTPKALESVFVWITHTGKNEGAGARGSNSGLGTVETEIAFYTDEKTGERMFGTPKQRDGDSDAAWSFSLVPTVVGLDPKDRPITSVYTEYGAKTGLALPGGKAAKVVKTEDPESVEALAKARATLDAAMTYATAQGKRATRRFIRDCKPVRDAGYSQKKWDAALLLLVDQEDVVPLTGGAGGNKHDPITFTPEGEARRVERAAARVAAEQEPDFEVEGEKCK